MKAPAFPAARTSWFLALATVVIAAAVCVHNHHPDLPRPLSLTLTLDPQSDGESQPLVVTGRVGVADLLHLHYVSADAVVFTYDHWGVPGVQSAPVRVVPGVATPLRIEMPSLWNTVGSQSSPQRLRVVYGGQVVLDQDVDVHPHSRAAVYLAVNPNRPSTGPVLHGQLKRDDGRRLQGPVSGYFSLGERLLAWLQIARGQWLVVLLLAACAGRYATRLRGLISLRSLPPRVMSGLRSHWVFALCATLCTLAYSLVLIHGRPDIDVPAYLRSFFDYQAASLLDGHLDVPAESIHGEAFIFQGKAYGYFGIVPALLRLPFVFFDVGFGQLTDAFMIAEFFGCLLFAYLILSFAWTVVHGPDSRPRAWAIVLLLANAGLGSTLFFVASRGFVYHEVLVAGACFALGAVYFALRYLAEPERRWWAGALLCGTLAVHCRPPMGLFALCLVGIIAGVTILRPVLVASAGGAWITRLPKRWSRHLAIALFALLGILSFNGLSYLKFRTFEGAPFRYHQQYDAQRLARSEGRNFHWSNLPLNSSAYLLRPGWSLRPQFPYLVTGSHAPGPGSKAKIDLAEPMLGLPYAMPGLFWLGFVGVMGSFWRCRRLRPTAMVLGLAALPMTLALFAAMATSQRYTADFVPFMVGAAALGAITLDTARPAWRNLGRGMFTVLTAFAILVSLALALRYQGELIWSIPERVTRSYQDMGRRMDSLLGIRPAAEKPPTP